MAIILISENVLIETVKIAGYAFSTPAGTFDDRFEIVYRDGTLGTDGFQGQNSIVAFKEGESVKVISSRSRIIAVEISDMQGRII